MADMDEVAGLLHVHEKAREHGDALKNIKDAAWERLVQINAEHGAKPAPEPEPETADEPEDPSAKSNPAVGSITVGGNNG